jgi:hypothetical protein
MFTKRHEQELAEIKATMHQLEERFEAILGQLERIRENQDELAAQSEPTSGHRPKRERRSARATAGEGTQPEGSPTEDRGSDESPQPAVNRKAQKRLRKQHRSRPAGSDGSTEE